MYFFPLPQGQGSFRPGFISSESYQTVEMMPSCFIILAMSLDRGALRQG